VVKLRAVESSSFISSCQVLTVAIFNFPPRIFRFLEAIRILPKRSQRVTKTLEKKQRYSDLHCSSLPLQQILDIKIYKNRDRKLDRTFTPWSSSWSDQLSMFLIYPWDVCLVVASRPILLSIPLKDVYVQEWHIPCLPRSTCMCLRCQKYIDLVTRSAPRVTETSSHS